MQCQLLKYGTAPVEGGTEHQAILPNKPLPCRLSQPLARTPNRKSTARGAEASERAVALYVAACFDGWSLSTSTNNFQYHSSTA